MRRMTLVLAPTAVGALAMVGLVASCAELALLGLLRHKLTRLSGLEHSSHFDELLNHI
ncbi:MAG: hypothetical protein ACI91O_000402 [Candidatus Poriferisodalaceae bacterium]|jgi:hypothetical protein